MEQLDGHGARATSCSGENPAVGSANASMQRLGMANLDWLVVRDFSLIESATWWKDGPEIETGEMRTEDIATEVFFFPAAAHTEKAGSFTNTNRMLQWHHKAVEPAGDARSDLWFMYHLGRLIREKLAGSTDEMDRPVLDLTWDYPTDGRARRARAPRPCWPRSTAGTPDGKPLSAYTELKDDGSTVVRLLDLLRRLRGRREPGGPRASPATEQNWVGAEWAWAWPANRRILYNRASADPDGRPWSERKALVWWDAEQGRVDRPRRARLRRRPSPPDYRPADDAQGPDAIAGDDPFIMQADGKGWLFAPAGLADGPLPTHYEPQESPVANPLYAQQRNPARQLYPHEHNRYHPSGDEPGAEVFPYVVTTYRLTEHFTAGGMSRLDAVSRRAAAGDVLRGLARAGRGARPRARRLGDDRHRRATRSRRGCWSPSGCRRCSVDGRVVHQIGLPFHWGPNGLRAAATRPTN